MRKRAALIGAAILVLLLGVVLALPWLIDANQYRGPIQTALQEQLGREVSLGDIRISLLPLGLRVADVVIGEDPALDTGRPFAAVEELYVSPRVLPLLTGRFELRAVEIRRPSIELVRTPSGAWNFATLGSGDAPSEGEPSLTLNRLTITSGSIGLTDASRPGATRVVYDNIDVELNDFAPDRAFDARVAVTLPGEGTQRITVNGTGGPLDRDDMMATPFEGTIGFEGASLTGTQQFLQLEALAGTDAVISGEAALANAEGRLSSKGALQLADTRVRGVAIDYPIAADFDLAFDTTAQLLTVSSATVRLDDTPLSLDGTVDLSPETPVLDVHLTAAQASLAEAARLAAAFGVAFGTNTQVQGTLDADVRARGPVTTPALEGSLRLREVAISGDDIPQPVRTPAVEVTLTPETVRSNTFTVATGGTSVEVSGAATGYTTPTPSIDARVRTQDADLGELLNVARAWGVTAAEDVQGSGRLSVDVQATGPVDALTYRGSGALSSASIRTPAITQPLGIRSARLTFDRDTASLQDLSASIGKTVADGRVSIRNFTAPQVQFQLSANTIDVAEMQQLLGGASPNQETPKADSDGTSMLRQVTGNGTIRVGSIVYDALVLEDVQATATLDHGLIRLDPLTAGLFGGRHRGAIAVDARQSPMAVTVGSDLERVDANQLASAVTNLRDVIFGALGTRARVHFNAAEGDGLVRSLNGTMSLNLADGRIANMNLTQEIGNIAKFVTGQAAGERTTQVAAMSGNFDVTSGVATTDDLTASIEGGNVGVRGTVNLVDQQLNLRVTAVLSRDYSQRVGGNSIGGFLTTALANQQGELVIPMLVTGTAQQPRFAPDVKQVAEMRLKNLVPSLGDPQSLTGSILGAVRGERGGGSGGGAASAIGGIVGAITGKPQPPQTPPAEKPDAETPPDGKSPETAKPEEKKDPASQIQDALRGILGGRRQEQK
jgi:AsmA protein